MDYKEKLEEAKRLYETANADQKYVLESLFPELKESEDELTWLTKYIEEEAYSLSMDIRDNEDRIKLKKLQKALAWLEKQAEVVSDKDDIEAEEKGIRKAFNKIWEEKQDKQKSQRMISAEAKEAMYDKPADKVEPKCEESKTKIFDAPTPFEDKLYAFVAACEFLAIPSKIEFILEHSQEILDAAKEQIGKEQSSAWSKEDEKMLNHIIGLLEGLPILQNWLKELKQRIGG